MNQYNWSPEIISEMYCDDLDFKGLKYWYDEAADISSKMKHK